MFRRLEGDTAVVKTKGVFTPTELYEWQDMLFVKLGSGYVRVYQDGRTTKAGVDVVHMETEAPLWADSFGRIALSPGEKRKPIAIANGETLAISHAPTKEGD